MHHSLIALVLLSLGQTDTLGPGDHKRTVTTDGLTRVHWIHVPPRYDPKKPTPLVLVLHGAMMDAKMMEEFCGMDKTADKHQFIAVYPNGTGPAGLFQTWNAGLFPGELTKNRVDDVKYLRKVLDDVAGVVNVDKKRVYATGLSNGGMMAYRVAAELSDRIAAIAAVGGTLALEKYEPKRPVPVVHFHGTKDALVPFKGPQQKKDGPAVLRFRGVDDTIQACVKVNGCAAKCVETTVDTKDEKVKVIRKEYPNPKSGDDVVLYVIENGGHTWPGMWAPPFLGLTTRDFSASEVLWEFFKNHPMP